MTGVWLPSLGLMAVWCVKAGVVVAVVAVVSLLWLGWTGRRWTR